MNVSKHGECKHDNGNVQRNSSKRDKQHRQGRPEGNFRAERQRMLGFFVECAVARVKKHHAPQEHRNGQCVCQRGKLEHDKLFVRIDGKKRGRSYKHAKRGTCPRDCVGCRTQRGGTHACSRRVGKRKTRHEKPHGRACENTCCHSGNTRNAI